MNDVFNSLAETIRPEQTTPKSIGTIEDIKTLEGQKATIFKYGEFGFPQSIKCTINKVYRKNYAQYVDLIHIEYRPKGKRTDYVCRVYDYSTMAVFNGHIDLQSDMYVKTIEKPGCLTVRESLLAFSNEYIDRALSSTNKKPIFLQVK